MCVCLLLYAAGEGHDQAGVALQLAAAHAEAEDLRQQLEAARAEAAAAKATAATLQQRLDAAHEQLTTAQTGKLVRNAAPTTA